jgi:hypothetical protein
MPLGWHEDFKPDALLRALFDQREPIEFSRDQTEVWPPAQGLPTWTID